LFLLFSPAFHFFPFLLRREGLDFRFFLFLPSRAVCRLPSWHTNLFLFSPSDLLLPRRCALLPLTMVWGVAFSLPSKGSPFTLTALLLRARFLFSPFTGTDLAPHENTQPFPFLIPGKWILAFFSPSSLGRKLLVSELGLLFSLPPGEQYIPFHWTGYFLASTRRRTPFLFFSSRPPQDVGLCFLLSPFFFMTQVDDSRDDLWATSFSANPFSIVRMNWPDS